MKIKRNILNDITKHLKAKEISLIIGSRQVGKTTLMKEMRAYLDIKNEKTLFLNLDFESDNKYFITHENFVNKLRLEFGNKKGYVFIDEIQRKQDAGLFLKGIFDMDLPYKFIVSGSGSIELKEKVHESLVGRKRIFELNPVSFTEFINFKTSYHYQNNLSLFFEVEKEKTLLFLEEYINFGGYPRVVTEEKKLEKNQIISEIYSSYFIRDIVYLLNIEKKESFSKTIKIIASQIGKIANLSNLSNSIGISIQTLKKYLWYAEKTFVIYSMYPFFKNKLKEITKSQTYYFYDLGLRNFSIDIFGNFSKEYGNGFLFQNFIANIIKDKIKTKNYFLNFWRTKDRAEVDFIVSKGQNILPIEVKYKNIRKREITKSLRSFIDKYNPNEAIIINLDYKDSFKVKNTLIKIMPFYELFYMSLFKN